MASVTIKELQEHLKKSDDTVKWQEHKIQELQKENERILDRFTTKEKRTRSNRTSIIRGSIFYNKI